MIADNKKKIELAITGMGIIALVFLLISYLPKSKDNKLASASRVTDVSFTSLQPEDSSSELWGRDPFSLDAPDIKEQGMEGLVLSGTVADKDNSYAIINNDVVKLGDEVGGMTIVEINEKNVVLDENGQRHILELNVY